MLTSQALISQSSEDAWFIIERNIQNNTKNFHSLFESLIVATDMASEA